MTNRMKTAGIVFLILSITWSMVIWSFSLKNAESSSVDSDSAKSVVESILETFFGEQIDIDNKLIRKLAHFCEFAVLGFFNFMTFYFFECRKGWELIFYPALWELVVAGIDEFLQLFFEGRSAQFSDVLLDMSGALSTVLILTVMLRLTNKKSRI